MTVAGRRRLQHLVRDRLAELLLQRTVLLRSLYDLEREYAAGDSVDVDYRELRDGDACLL